MKQVLFRKRVLYEETRMSQLKTQSNRSGATFFATPLTNVLLNPRLSSSATPFIEDISKLFYGIFREFFQDILQNYDRSKATTILRGSLYIIMYRTTFQLLPFTGCCFISCLAIRTNFLVLTIGGHLYAIASVKAGSTITKSMYLK